MEKRGAFASRLAVTNVLSNILFILCYTLDDQTLVVQKIYGTLHDEFFQRKHLS